MRRSKQDKELDEQISKSVIQTMSYEQLEQVRNFIVDYQKYKKYDKLYSTYIKGAREALRYNENGRIYVDYRLEGTVTGRLSNAAYKAKEKMGMSFHTLPREDEDIDVNIREYVVAPEGYDFITTDYKGMELRVVAHLAKEATMMKKFNDGIDLHTYSASMVFNKSPEKVSPIERQICKEVSFLIIFGGGEYTLAAKKRIPLKRAKKIIDTWLETFSGLKVYFQNTFDFIVENGYAETLFGRRRHLPDVNSYISSIKERSLRQGLNYTVQSSASDIMVCGLIGINQELKLRNLDAYINGTVHDSVEIVSNKKHTEEVLQIIYHQLVNYPYLREKFGIELLCPLEVDIEVGQSFGSGQKVKLATSV